MTLQGAVAKSVLHALRLLGFIVEKGSNRVLSLAGRRPFLGSIVALTDGTKGVEVQSKSLLLIRQWGEQYKDSENKNFHDTLSMLQRQGIQFPEFGDEDVKASAQVENKLSDSCSRDPSDTRHGEFRQELTKRERQIAKLQADLANVMEKMTTVNELLENADPKDDEQLENLYEFLRQCRPRMNALIEGGLQGRISEEMLEECLNVKLANMCIDTLIKSK